MSFKNACLGGLAGTLAVTVALWVQHAVQFLPGFDLVEFVHRLTGGPALYGWLAHIGVGVLVWPLIFMCLERHLPGRRRPERGLWFGVFAWAVAMLIFCPVVGAGFFGLVIGWTVPLLALALHLLYGSLLDALY